ncbi:hypothetical protein KIPB_004021 [Kipferlia bialata]|uniref:Uncharacterized protein n=2 Tax=Kipferlia bialata TaxID=797122 RepID=A0A9K3CTB0_9EUKA|nr:hypothetical protein KIPB_004021 [Kipferlia bialata]|eukprot:g4021.t1
MSEFVLKTRDDYIPTDGNCKKCASTNILGVQRRLCSGYCVSCFQKLDKGEREQAWKEAELSEKAKWEADLDAELSEKAKWGAEQRGVAECAAAIASGEVQVTLERRNGYILTTDVKCPKCSFSGGCSGYCSVCWNGLSKREREDANKKAEAEQPLRTLAGDRKRQDAASAKEASASDKVTKQSRYRAQVLRRLSAIGPVTLLAPNDTHRTVQGCAAKVPYSMPLSCLPKEVMERYGHTLPHTMPPGVEVRAFPPCPQSVDTVISHRALGAAKSLFDAAAGATFETESSESYTAWFIPSDLTDDECPVVLSETLMPKVSLGCGSDSDSSRYHKRGKGIKKSVLEATTNL